MVFKKSSKFRTKMGGGYDFLTSVRDGVSMQLAFRAKNDEIPTCTRGWWQTTVQTTKRLYKIRAHDLIFVSPQKRL